MIAKSIYNLIVTSIFTFSTADVKTKNQFGFLFK